MALTPDAHKALLHYIAQAAEAGTPHKATIRKAIVLTASQREALREILSAFWKISEYACPLMLDLKPQHGYSSRVIKDGFPSAQYVEWLVLGCSDVAEVSTDYNGRPNLILRAVRDHRAVSYDVLVPIRSTMDGYVHVDDVIPKGLRATQKKAAPSAFP